MYQRRIIGVVGPTEKRPFDDKNEYINISQVIDGYIFLKESVGGKVERYICVELTEKTPVLGVNMHNLVASPCETCGSKRSRY